jgi:hypothetical protein
MKELNLITLAVILINAGIYAQSPNIEWSSCYGGTSMEVSASIKSTDDGGYILAGYTTSNDDDVSGNHGGKDCWIIKLNNVGDTVWTKCIGGSGSEKSSDIQQTNDNGFIVLGISDSNNGDAIGNHGSYDYFVIKMNSLGDIEWTKCLGGTNDDFEVHTIRQTTDEGYIFIGDTYSYNGDVSCTYSNLTTWIVKLDSAGDISWEKCLVGSNSYIEQAEDGGYIAFNSISNEYKITKLDINGDSLWSKTYGGSNDEYPNGIGLSGDGGYFLIGNTSSSDGDVFGYNGGTRDAWVLKVNSVGEIIWTKCLGGPGDDIGKSCQSTSDGGCIIAGTSDANGGYVHGIHGSIDYWIVKLNNEGDTLWTKCTGGSDWDFAMSIQQTEDEGYIVLGHSNSTDGDVQGNHGNYMVNDLWVVKLVSDSTAVLKEESINECSIYPNPINDYLKIETQNKSYIEIRELNGKIVKTVKCYGTSIILST